MEKAIQLFSNENFGSIRVVTVAGEPWFVAKDVCDILDVKNPSMALKSLDDSERARFNLGRQGDANIISESGFYTLVLRSRKPEAKHFRKWVTSEVLPSIRKTGSYSHDSVPNIPALPCQQAEVVLQTYLSMASMLQVPLHISQTEAVKEVQLQTGVDLSNLLVHSPAQSDIKDSEVMLEPKELGKLFGISGIRMNKLLAALGLQKKVSGSWKPVGLGKKISVRHHWKNGKKSGYNYKWNAEEVKKIVSKINE